jgi:hypothetical protein
MPTKATADTTIPLATFLSDYVARNSRQLIEASAYLGWMLLMVLTWASPQQGTVLLIFNLMFAIGSVTITWTGLEVIFGTEPANTLLREASIFLTLAWGIGLVGDELFAHFSSAPQDLAIVLTPALLVRAVWPLLKRRRLEAEPGWVHPATMANASLPELSESDRWHVAYHEAAHALLHCAMRTPPSQLTMSLHRRGPPGTPHGVVHIIEAHRLDRESYVRLHLLVLLAGQVGERLRMGETTIGGESDLAKWIQAAKRYLSSKEDTLYYPEPANTFESAHNDAELDQLRRQCLEQVQAFLERNEVAHRALADALIEREHMDLEDMRPYFRLASVPEDFPRPG